MAAAWQPQEAGVAELVQLFKDSQTPGKETQMRIAEVSRISYQQSFFS